MVAAVQVFRVQNPDGTTSDFASLAEAVRHEVRFGLLTAVAGLPENATPAQEAMVDALIDDPKRFHDLLGQLVAALPKATPPAPQPVVIAPPAAASLPRSAPAAPASRGPGGNRGPGFKVRQINEGEALRGAAFGDGKEDA